MDGELAESAKAELDPANEEELDIEVEEPDQNYETRTFTIEKQNEFLRYFEQNQCKRQAARQADVPPSTVEYAIKNNESFRRMYENSKEYAAERLLEEAYDRAIEGHKVPIFQNGERVGEKTIKSDRLLKTLLESYVDEVGKDDVDVQGDITLEVKPPDRGKEEPKPVVNE